MKGLTTLCRTVFFRITFFRITGLSIACLALTVIVCAAQTAGRPERVQIPKDAVTIEGVPTVRVDDTGQATTRHALTAEEAAKYKLQIRVKNGQYYWASRDDKPLAVSDAGAYTYLTSEPGRYVRFTKLNDRITYVEHVDQEFGSVTFRGELRIGLGK